MQQALTLTSTGNKCGFVSIDVVVAVDVKMLHMNFNCDEEEIDEEESKRNTRNKRLHEEN